MDNQQVYTCSNPLKFGYVLQFINPKNEYSNKHMERFENVRDILDM